MIFIFIALRGGKNPLVGFHSLCISLRGNKDSAVKVHHIIAMRDDNDPSIKVQLNIATRDWKDFP